MVVWDRPQQAVSAILRLLGPAVALARNPGPGSRTPRAVRGGRKADPEITAVFILKAHDSILELSPIEATPARTSRVTSNPFSRMLY